LNNQDKNEEIDLGEENWFKFYFHIFLILIFNKNFFIKKNSILIWFFLIKSLWNILLKLNIQYYKNKFILIDMWNSTTYVILIKKITIIYSNIWIIAFNDIWI
jgi:hypothetical protein